MNKETIEKGMEPEGVNLWINGEKFWFRSSDLATQYMRENNVEEYCNDPQVINVATGKKIYGKKE